MSRQWYDLRLGTFDENIHDVLCTRCNMCSGPCPCQYEITDEACKERSKHEELSFMVTTAQRLLARM